jgi:hypothetical protein
MSLSKLMTEGLPLNRKERYYTGTVFPAIVCAEEFAHFGRLAGLIKGCPPLMVDPHPRTANIQVFTEYGLWESIFTEHDRARFPTFPESRDTPDILIFAATSPALLIAIEAKMYDRPSKDALEAQLSGQRKVVLDRIAPVLGVQPKNVFHRALLPKQLLHEPGYKSLLSIPVITWQELHSAFTEGRSEDHWLAVLRLALESYEQLVSRAAPRKQHADDVLTGATIYDGLKSGKFPFQVMGRSQGEHGDPLREDVESGGWRKQRYEVSHSSEPPNRNWFPVAKFVSLVEALGVLSSGVLPFGSDIAVHEPVSTGGPPTPLAVQAIGREVGVPREGGELLVTPPTVLETAKTAASEAGLRDARQAELTYGSIQSAEPYWLGSSNCKVCGDPTSGEPTAYLCPRCKKVRGPAQLSAELKAARFHHMSEQWRRFGEFRCHYTGVKLDLDDPNSVRYREWDHATPGDEGSVVLATALVNRMKCYLRANEFEAMIVELARHFADPTAPFTDSVYPTRQVPQSQQT